MNSQPRNFTNLLTQPRLIAAHRGYRALYPENTRCSFDACRNHCHFLETDVQMCEDAIPVIMHDPDLQRTSDASALAAELGRSSLLVDRWSLSDLRRLDIGSWYLDADPFKAIAQAKTTAEALRKLMPQQIMTLEELLNWAALHKMFINIEIKDHSSSRFDSVITPSIVEIIARTSTADLVILSSFKHEYLKQCKKLRPDIPIAVLQEEGHPPGLLEYLHDLDALAYHPWDRITDHHLIRTLRHAGFAVNVFTVNDRERQKQLFDYGVNAIFTDYPELPETALAQ